MVCHIPYVRIILEKNNIYFPNTVNLKGESIFEKLNMSIKYK